MDKYDRLKQWQEVMKLIAQYDWAVETDLQSNNGVDRNTARAVRARLVGVAKEITL